MTREAIAVKAIDLVLRGGRGLGEESEPLGIEINLRAHCPGRRGSGHAVEAVAAKDKVAMNRRTVVSSDHRSVIELHRFDGGSETNVASR